MIFKTTIMRAIKIIKTSEIKSIIENLNIISHLEWMILLSLGSWSDLLTQQIGLSIFLRIYLMIGLTDFYSFLFLLLLVQIPSGNNWLMSFMIVFVLLLYLIPIDLPIWRNVARRFMINSKLAVLCIRQKKSDIFLS